LTDPALNANLPFEPEEEQMGLIAFDMDGTLYDCSNAIVAAYGRGSEIINKQFNLDFKVPTLEAIQSVLGQTELGFFGTLFPGIDPALIPQINVILTRELSFEVKSGKGELYDGVVPLFKKLHRDGWKIVIASNGQMKYLCAIIETYHLSEYIACEPVTIDDKGINTKSDILAACRKRFADDEPFVMVGDRHSDLVAARDNSAYFIGCAFGHASDDEIAGADAVVHSLDEVYELSLTMKK
jgi:adenosylhomocysteine nucleosidase